MNGLIVLIGIIGFGLWIANVVTSKQLQRKLLGHFGSVVLVVSLLLIVVGSSFTIIPTGSVGIVYQMGVLDKNEVRGVGIQWHIPFIQKIERYSVMQQNANEAAEDNARIWGESKDKLPIYCQDLRITYQVNPKGMTYLFENIADMTEIESWGRTASSAFAAATIQLNDVDVAKQSMVEPLMLTEMQRLTDEKYGKTADGESNITIVRVLIGYLEYEQAYQDAITNRKNAEQLAIEQEVTNAKEEAMKKSAAEQARIEAEGIANAKIETAKGEAEAMLTLAEAEASAIIITAEAEASANKKISDSLTEAVLKQQELEARLKHGWVTINGGGSVIIDERTKTAE